MADMVPGKLSLDTGGDSICRALQRLDLKNVSILRPDIEAAPHSTVSAHCLGSTNARLAHCLLGFRYTHDCAVTGLGLNAFDDIDHSLQRRFRQPRKKPGVTGHRLFH